MYLGQLVQYLQLKLILDLYLKVQSVTLLTLLIHSILL